MMLNPEHPTGCRATVLAFNLPGRDYPRTKEGLIALICGDRKMEFLAEHPAAIEYSDLDTYSSERLKMTKFAADALCGFCVECPNRLRLVGDDTAT